MNENGFKLISDPRRSKVSFLEDAHWDFVRNDGWDVLENLLHFYLQTDVEKIEPIKLLQNERDHTEYSPGKLRKFCEVLEDQGIISRFDRHNRIHIGQVKAHKLQTAVPNLKKLRLEHHLRQDRVDEYDVANYIDVLDQEELASDYLPRATQILESQTFNARQEAVRWGPYFLQEEGIDDFSADDMEYSLFALEDMGMIDPDLGEIGLKDSEVDLLDQGLETYRSEYR